MMKVQINQQWLKFSLLTILFLNIGSILSAEVTQNQKKIETSEYTLLVKNSESIYLETKDSQELLQLGEFRLVWTPAISPAIGGCELINEDGYRAIRANFKLPADVPSTIKLTGTFIARSYGIDVRYDITGVPEGYVSDWGGSQFKFKLADGSVELPVAKLGMWQRNEKGGIPVEVADSRFQVFSVKNRTICLAFGDENKANFDWKEDSFRHTSLTKIANGQYSTQFSILIGASDWSNEAINARWKNRPFSLTLATEKTYNWRENTSGGLSIDATLINTSDEAKTAILKYWVRNFSGDLLVNKSEKLSIKEGERIVKKIQFNSSNDRDIFFTEVSVEDEQGQELVFSRTNLSLLPPHTFNASSENSIMGLSAYWHIPNSEEMKRLIGRMGVRWLRHGNVAEFKDIECMSHNNIDWHKNWTDEERDAFIRDSFDEMLAKGNKIWEFGNELNMGKPGGIALAGNGIGEAFFVKPYVEWLKAIRKVQAQNPAWKDIKIISFGFAGLDKVFLDKLVEHGGWELIDGLTLHPGRGNFAPDYPVYQPWTNWAEKVYEKESDYMDIYLSETRKKKGLEIKSDDSYWNFYGAVRLAKNFIKCNGGNKDLYLTEIYSLDWPNCWWNDTPRKATENVILTYGLSAAEGVKNALYYQLFNSVWFDQLGVNANDREYSFGLINRDLSFKPLLMAFCTIAEALDEAKFEGWINFSDKKNENTRGMLFDTPRGSMAILWDRSEGFVLTKESDDYISTEPWVDDWTTQVEVNIPTENSNITILNSIGQKETIASKRGNSKISLTGSPVIVYGVDSSKIRLH